MPWYKDWVVWAMIIPAAPIILGELLLVYYYLWELLSVTVF